MSEKEVRFEENGIVHVLTVDEEGKPIKKKQEEKKSSRKWWKYAIFFTLVVYPKLALISLLNLDYHLGSFLDWLEIALAIETLYIISESEKISGWLKFILYPLIIIGYWILFSILGLMFAFLIALFM